jgi:hypothetical protein
MRRSAMHSAESGNIPRDQKAYITGFPGVKLQGESAPEKSRAHLKSWWELSGLGFYAENAAEKIQKISQDLINIEDVASIRCPNMKEPIAEVDGI